MFIIIDISINVLKLIFIYLNLTKKLCPCTKKTLNQLQIVQKNNGFCVECAKYILLFGGLCWALQNIYGFHNTTQHHHHHPIPHTH